MKTPLVLAGFLASLSLTATLAAADAPAIGKGDPTVSQPNPTVLIKTGMGDLTIELFEDQAPNTVANFISLVESGFYNGIAFHRIIPGFMAQGGCPNAREGASGVPGTGGPGYRFADEINPALKHTSRGLLSMANAGPNTNGSQFFLCFTATPWLDGKHAVFGKVIKGQEVLDKLEAVGTQSGRPTQRVVMEMQVLSKRAHPYAVKKL
ncbi:MAG: peptidylprolyl isomerase [Lentisphaeria bacterium]